jgi:hypothetical protein
LSRDIQTCRYSSSIPKTLPPLFNICGRSN